MNNYLEDIIDNKIIEIDMLKASFVRREVSYTRHRSFKQFFNDNELFIIAEIKRNSPSKENLAEIPDPIGLAEKYQLGGANGISVLTDTYGFKGTINDLSNVSKSSSLPILRKDFILDPIQIDETILAGADAALLIVSILKENTKILFDYAKSLGIDVFIEVNNVDELKYAISIGAEIIMVNNRNLHSFEVDTNNAKNLIQYIPSHIISIAASGISNKKLMDEYKKIGYRGVLIGESLVKQNNVIEYLKSLREKNE